MTLEIWLVYKGTKGNSPFNRDTPSWFAVYLNKGKFCHPSKTLRMGSEQVSIYHQSQSILLFELPDIDQDFGGWTLFEMLSPPEKNTVHMVTPVVAAWLFLLFFDEKIPRPKIRQTPSGSTADPMGLRLGSPKLVGPNDGGGNLLRQVKLQMHIIHKSRVIGLPVTQPFPYKGLV